jgi:elongation of very long chain fatty acids protein 7
LKLWECQNEGQNAFIEIASYYALNLKLFTLIESIVIVLRKKTNQMSKMHVYHRITTIMLIWGLLRTGDTTKVFFLIVDKTGDVVRFIYYLLSNFGNYTRLYMFLKRVKPMLIIMQLIQFVVIILHSTVTVMGDCEKIPKVYYLIIANSVLFFWVYLKFYRENFNKKTHVK